MINRILFATDLGLYSPYLMRQLSQVATSMQATVDIIHVIDPMGVFAESIINSYVPDKDRRYLRQHGLADVLDRIKRQVTQTLKTDYIDMLDGVELGDVIVEQGHPAEVIIKQVFKQHSNLLLLGSHGQSAFQGGPMGSVVSKVMQLSPIPVLMVPMINLGDLDRTDS
jgi:nucleotide-binding universal stress UspA family protein